MFGRTPLPARTYYLFRVDVIIDLYVFNINAYNLFKETALFLFIYKIGCPF